MRVTRHVATVVDPAGARQLLRLDRGAHLAPADGMCLMELVSVLAGCRFSDRPPCTDTTLATVARVVNDELREPARQDLLPLAGDLARRRGDPVAAAPAVVRACLEVAARYLPETPPDLARHQRRAARRLAGTARRRDAVAGVRGRLYERGPAQRAIVAMALSLRRLPAGRREQALLEVLHTALRVPQLAGRG